LWNLVTYLIQLQNLEWRDNDNLFHGIHQERHHKWHGFARTSASNHNRGQTKNNSLSYIKLPVVKIIPESFSKNICQSRPSFVCIIVFLLRSCLTSVLAVAIRVGMLLIERFLTG